MSVLSELKDDSLINSISSFEFNSATSVKNAARISAVEIYHARPAVTLNASNFNTECTDDAGLAVLKRTRGFLLSNLSSRSQRSNVSSSSTIILQKQALSISLVENSKPYPQHPNSFKIRVQFDKQYYRDAIYPSSILPRLVPMDIVRLLNK